MSRIVDTIRATPPEEPERDGAGAHERRGDPRLGVVSYFHFEDRDTVDRVMDRLQGLGVSHLRTGVSWAEWCRPDGERWFEWLLPKLIEAFDVLPCVLYTPPDKGIIPKTSSPPKHPEEYADFVASLLSRYEGAFSHVELWNEPNNYIEWDWTIDPEWVIFAKMIRAATERAAERHVGAVLGGMSPLDPNWLNLMYERGAMDLIDVIGIHGFPGTWEAVWDGWTTHIDRVLEVSHRFDSDPEIWITEAGFSTWAHDEFRQVTELEQLAEAPVERAYWYSAEDLDPVRETLDGFHADERAYHFGLHRRSGEPKLVARVWRDGGIEGVREMARLGREGHGRARSGATLITGGAGFVGCNLADRIASEGKPVVIFDSLARPGVERNLRWLKDRWGDRVDAEISDVRDRFALRRALTRCDEVFHLAAQVAVTTSLDDPQTDLAVNTQGTVNLLEEIRRLDEPPPVLFTSTNKVYGALDDIALTEGAVGYEPNDLDFDGSGIDETRPLSLCSPYGCSKGAADQYVIDYAHSYGLRTAVFRMSCIYGPRQFGTEDQGWVAHFLISALNGDPITVFGNGKQVRDLLYVDDLVDALLRTIRSPRAMTGRAFNVGGGPCNRASLLEVIEEVERRTGRSLSVRWADWRTGDQRYYVSDTSLLRGLTGWTPRVGVAEGIESLHAWLRQEGDESHLLAAGVASVPT